MSDTNTQETVVVGSTALLGSGFAVALPDTRGNNCYLTSGEGDPPRTYTAKLANRYKSTSAAQSAIKRARKTTPFRERTMLVVPLPARPMI